MKATYRGATDEGLVDLIAKCEKDHQYHTGMIEAIETDLAAMRSEQARRAMKALRKQHRGVTMNIGDELLVTDKFREHRDGLYMPSEMRLYITRSKGWKANQGRL